jgi:hypothetical protein
LVNRKLQTRLGFSPAPVFKLGAGGKSSTWLPPGGLSEHKPQMLKQHVIIMFSKILHKTTKFDKLCFINYKLFWFFLYKLTIP